MVVVDVFYNRCELLAIRVFPCAPTGSWGRPGGVSGPPNLSCPKSLAPGDQGTGAAGAAGLRAAGAGGGIPAPQSEARCSGLAGRLLH